MSRKKNKKISYKKHLITICYGLLITLFLELSPEHLLAKEPSINSLGNNPPTEAQPSNALPGRTIYLSHCALCHGPEGKGDGRMEALIRNPPPYNLTQSTRPASYLKNIITNGGASLSRSTQMPLWKDELTSAEIEALAIYLLTLRE